MSAFYIERTRYVSRYSFVADYELTNERPRLPSNDVQGYLATTAEAQFSVFVCCKNLTTNFEVGVDRTEDISFFPS
jgi:hypothetical protein